MQLNEVKSPQAPAAMSLEDKISLMCVVGTPPQQQSLTSVNGCLRTGSAGLACSLIM